MTISNQSIEYLDVDKISKDPADPIKNSRGQIRKMCRVLEEFEVRAPVLLDQKQQLIADHLFYECARHMNKTQIPATVADHLRPEEVVAFRIAPKKLEEETTWNKKKLVQAIDELVSIEFDIELVGFTPIEVVI